MIDIQEIAQKVMEEENNLIAKAFTSHIGSLLINNGIVPVMTKYTFNDLNAITDTDKYKIVKEFGISFDELDTREHDNKVRNKAIDDCIDMFADILSNIPNICGRQCPVKCNWGTEENCKEMCKKWLAEQMKKRG